MKCHQTGRDADVLLSVCYVPDVGAYTPDYSKSFHVCDIGTVSPILQIRIPNFSEMKQFAQDTPLARRKMGFKSGSEDLQSCWVSTLLLPPEKDTK